MRVLSTVFVVIARARFNSILTQYYFIASKYASHLNLFLLFYVFY